MSGVRTIVFSIRLRASRISDSSIGRTRSSIMVIVDFYCRGGCASCNLTVCEGHPSSLPVSASRSGGQDRLNGFQTTGVSAFTMIKITGTALVAAAMLIASSAFAGDKDKACCAKGVSNTEKTACVDLATLNLTPDQKTKIEAWQAECMKAGCTKESRRTFFTHDSGRPRAVRNVVRLRFFLGFTSGDDAILFPLGVCIPKLQPLMCLARNWQNFIRPGFSVICDIDV